MTLEELLKVVPANTDLVIRLVGTDDEVTSGQAIDILCQKALLVQDVAMVYPMPGDSMINEKGKLIIKLQC